MKIRYKLNDNKDGLVVTGFYNLKDKVRIPSEGEFEGRTYPVTEISQDAFCSCDSLTSINIPDSVTEIGEKAFLFCSGLTSISIPDSVTMIGSWAFEGCSNLRKIIISDASLLEDAGVPEGVEIVTP